MSSDSLHSPWSTIPYPASIDLHHYLWRSDKNVKIWKIHRLSHYINSPSEIDKSTFPLHLAPSVWWYLNPFMTDFEKSFVQVCKNSVIFAIKSIYFNICCEGLLTTAATQYADQVLAENSSQILLFARQSGFIPLVLRLYLLSTSVSCLQCTITSIYYPYFICSNQKSLI